MTIFFVIQGLLLIYIGLLLYLVIEIILKSDVCAIRYSYSSMPAESVVTNPYFQSTGVVMRAPPSKHLPRPAWVNKVVLMVCHWKMYSIVIVWEIFYFVRYLFGDVCLPSWHWIWKHRMGSHPIHRYRYSLWLKRTGPGMLHSCLSRGQSLLIAMYIFYLF